MISKGWLAVSVVAVVAFGAACGSTSDDSSDHTRWCELTIQNTAVAQTLSDAQLDEWVDVSPEEVRQETESFVVIAQELRKRIIDAPPEEQSETAREALAEMFSNPAFQQAGITIEQYAIENCPDFEG